jgi:hypothetical protein
MAMLGGIIGFWFGSRGWSKKWLFTGFI